MRRLISLLRIVLLLAIPATAAALVAADSAGPHPRRQAEEFHRLVGGLGGGPAVDLARCAFSFDPRQCADCPLNHGPIPGGKYFCPQHACSILYYPPLAPQAAPGAEDSNGGPP